MFFIMGISNGENKINFLQTILCKCCGQFGRNEAFMTYTMLSLFFIPVLKWNKHYYVKTSCCKTVYEVSSELGKRIVKGEQIELMDKDLSMVNGKIVYKRCYKCGFTTGENFEYCPKCGEKLAY